VLRTFEELCPGQSPEEVLVDYAVMYFQDSDWPASVILAVLELTEPDRTYAVDAEEGDLVQCCDAVDVTEGIDVAEARMEEIAAMENRLAELKCQLKGENVPKPPSLREIADLVEIAMNDPEGSTTKGADASEQLEELAWAAGVTKEQTAAASDWAAVGSLLVAALPPETQVEECQPAGS
jgi:hypothetical protein